jgi:predicted dehydrogenase
LKLGIIGLGRVAWLLEEDPLRRKPATHWGAWQQVKGVRLSAVCDNDPQRLKAFQERFPNAKGYLRYEEMLAQESLDLLSIAAHADTRCEMVLAASKAGVRGIWCEKAMGTTLQEARRIERAVKRHGVHLAMSYPRRWGGAYQWVAQALKSGELGKLESINVQFPSNFIHTGTHAFDVLRMLGGEVQSVQGWLEPHSQRVKDSGYQFGTQFDEASPQNDLGGFGVLWFKSGARATLQASRKNYFRFEFEVLTDRALVRIGNTQRALFKVGDSPNFSGFSELISQPFPELEEKNVFTAIALNLVEAVQRGVPVACNAADGRKALEIGIALHQSHASGHLPVKISEVGRGLKVQSR